MVDDERGPCGDVYVNKGIEGVSTNGRGPSKSNSNAQSFDEALQRCNKVKVGCNWKVNQAWGLISIN